MPVKKFTKSEKGFAPLLVLLALFAALFASTTVAANISQKTDYPVIQSPNVLGDTSEYKMSEEEMAKLKELKLAELKLKEDLWAKEKEKKASMEAEYKRKKEELKKKEESAKKDLERKKELLKRQNELRQMAKEQKASREAQLEDPELKELEETLGSLQNEIKKTDDGKVVLEQSIGDLKLRYKYENGRLVVKAQAENGAEIEVDDPQVVAVKEQLEKTLKNNGGLPIATESGKVLLGKNKIKAWARGTVTVDPETNQMTITTPNGQKVVTVLPDEAVNNLVSKKVISEVEFDKSLQDPSSSNDSIVGLEDKNDQVVYKIKGKKLHKLLGLIPVKTDTTAFVSAENGELVSKEESLLAKFLDILSF